jgi:hypothetical protein
MAKDILWKIETHLPHKTGGKENPFRRRIILNFCDIENLANFSPKKSSKIFLIG